MPSARMSHSRRVEVEALCAREYPLPLGNGRARVDPGQHALCLVRVEFRNPFYNTKPESSTVRFRNRLQLLSPVNRELLTHDGAAYVLLDWEVHSARRPCRAIR